MTSENGELAETWTVSVEVEMPSSVVDISVAHFNLYPSPFVSGVRLFFELQRKYEVALNIYNVDGQIVYRRNLGLLEKHDQWIDLFTLEVGVYYLQIISEAKVLVMKQIVKMGG